MKAAVYRQYGPPEVVRIEEVPNPVPKDHELLIGVKATTVTTADWRARSLDLPPGFSLLGPAVFGFGSPRKQVLGLDFAGDVVGVGKSVTLFKRGDAVFGAVGARMGCHAELLCMPQSGAVTAKPANVSYDDAAAICFGGFTAVDFFRRGQLAKGERVLVNGASGAVGVACVQLARHHGAHVTAVCSGANAELVRSLGAHEVIDYTHQDFTQNGERYDVIVDTAGTSPYSRCKGSLAKGGRLLAVLGGFGELLAAPFVGLATQHRVVAGPAKERVDDLKALAKLAESGALKAVIDSRFPLERIADAHRIVDSKRKRGAVVVTM